MDVVITGWVDYSTRCESAESHDEAWEKYQETKKVWSFLPDNPGCEACGYPMDEENCVEGEFLWHCGCQD